MVPALGFPYIGKLTTRNAPNHLEYKANYHTLGLANVTVVSPVVANDNPSAIMQPVVGEASSRVSTLLAGTCREDGQYPTGSFHATGGT